MNRPLCLITAGRRTLRRRSKNGGKNKRRVYKSLHGRDPIVWTSRDTRKEAGPLRARVCPGRRRRTKRSEVVNGALEARVDEVYPRESWIKRQKSTSKDRMGL